MYLNKTIAVVVPAYNEEKLIARTLKEIPDLVDNMIVVDDASTDNTAKIIAELVENDQRIQLIQHEENQGVGGAIATGYKRARDLEIDAYSGAFEFLSQGINIRAFIDGTMYFPLPGLTFGLLRITIPSDIGILTEGIPEYLMGSPYDPLAVLDEGSGNPAMLTLVRTFQETYELELWYRLLLHVRDTGINGVIDVSIVVVEFESAEAIRGLNEGTFNLVVNKTRVEVNPTRYGFNVNNDPITTSGDDFEITANKITGPETIYSSTGTRTAVNFNLVVITLGFQIISLG